ncbi:MAG: glycosyltransferase [Patescibacteria group bacterium]
MTTPSLSIIIPTLNEERYLPTLLTDLSRQTYRDFEVVIVDGHSDDRSVAKANLFAHRLPQFTLLDSPTRNVCQQRNLGAENAQAETLLFLDADNRLEPHFLLGLKYRQEQSKADFFTTWVKAEENSLATQAADTLINLYMESQKNTPSPFGVEAAFGANRTQFLKLKGFDRSPCEGARLLKKAVTKKMTFAVFKDPTYSYSLRRVRKLGTFNAISRYAITEIYRLLDLKLPKKKAASLYPMKGGNFYETEALRQSFFENILSKVKFQKQKDRLSALARSFLFAEEESDPKH